MSITWQIMQTLICLLPAPFLVGLTKLIKSRLQGRRGPSPFQPYYDLMKLLRKDAFAAESTSWLFRAAPYLIFGIIWLAASMIPTFTTNLFLIPAADLIVLVAMLGAARFLAALAGLDPGTSFGGIGASREMLIASLAEPATLMIIFALSVLAGTTAPAHIVDFVLNGGVGIEVSMGLAIVALLMVTIAENGRIPIDNPATHLELTMVHEAMVLEYSGRHLAFIEMASMVKLQLYLSLIACIAFPWGIAQSGGGISGILLGFFSYLGKLVVASVALAVFETGIAKMRVFRVADFLSGALLLAVLATIFLYVSKAV